MLFWFLAGVVVGLLVSKSARWLGRKLTRKEGQNGN